MVASPAFSRSPVRRRLLRFIVAESEAGRGPLVKSYTVAVDCLGRGEDIDAQQDSYPRVQIGRLRKALDSLYGHNAPVNGLRFELRPGSYEIHFIETQAGRGGGSTQMFPPAGGSQGRLGSGTLVWFLTLLFVAADRKSVVEGKSVSVGED